MKSELPLERIYDLSDLSDAGHEARVAASSPELLRIAEWEGVDEVALFEAVVTLKRLSQNRFSYSATLTADVVQSCVVTLEPVRTRIARQFTRVLHYLPGTHLEKGGELTLAAGDDEAPEEIASLKYNLSGPLLEEFSLAVEPYPRAPGVSFDAPAQGEEKPESPFAVLKGLKRS